MNTSAYVENLISDLKSKGNVVSDVAWKAALACVGWPYVFGGRGEYCTPNNRRSRYSSAHPTTKTACQNFDGNGTCVGCKWYPNKKRVRFFDCRGFTYWVLLQVYGWKLMGAGATSQWNTSSNWKAKGEIATMPKDTLCCLFVRKGTTMEHTGFGLNDATVECSSGVQYFAKRKTKWTHWAVPACIEGTFSEPTPEPTPDPSPTPTHRTLRKGSSGSDVAEMQSLLISRGYSLPRYGADGDFGSETLAAVKKYQKDHGLAVDGVVGPKTWESLLTN